MKKILALSLFIILAATPVHALEPLSILNFDKSAVLDDAGNEWLFNGDPLLSSTEYISGGKSLYLDGNSYIQAKDTELFNFPGEFTLTAWIYPQKFVTDHYGGATFTVFSRWLHGIRTLYLVNIEKVDDNNGKLKFYTDFEGIISIESKASVPLNKWTHIAITRDAEKIIRLFINGKLEGEKRITQNFTSTDFPMTIGASSNAMRKSIGYIDDWAVYKTCLYTRDFDVSGRSDKKENDDEHEKISAADEIRKFKGLLDDGIITQEEFNAVKKKLLGL